MTRAQCFRGVDVVFGIPGVHNIELYRGLHTSGVRAISPRHEQGAGFMADGWSIITGRPGVCVLVSGPGLTNALTPIAQAYHDSRPMLVLVVGSELSDTDLYNNGRSLSFSGAVIRIDLDVDQIVRRDTVLIGPRPGAITRAKRHRRSLFRGCR
jgi:thiamine pyrophosphate-dependent acetolactate synthase large subunit-like protein